MATDPNNEEYSDFEIPSVEQAQIPTETYNALHKYEDEYQLITAHQELKEQNKKLTTENLVQFQIDLFQGKTPRREELQNQAEGYIKLVEDMGYSDFDDSNIVTSLDSEDSTSAVFFDLIAGEAAYAKGSKPKRS